MKTIAYSIMVLCLLLSTGCSESKQIQSNNFNSIIGMRWNLGQMTVDGAAFEVSARKSYIQFTEDGKVSGSGSINRFFGSVNIDADGNVTWPTPMGSTRMAGPPNLMKQEHAILQALPKTERLTKSGNRLTFTSNDAQTQLVFFAAVE